MIVVPVLSFLFYTQQETIPPAVCSHNEILVGGKKKSRDAESKKLFFEKFSSCFVINLLNLPWHWAVCRMQI